MKIAIIGGGFTGLSAAYELSKKGHEVTLFEREKTLGGLASGFKEKKWTWHLEQSYHHLFTNDDAIVKLIFALHLENKLIRKRPITANLYNGNIYQLDSPISLLCFPMLSLADKVKTAVLLGFLKLNPFWRPLEKITAEQLLCSIGGKKSYKTLWEPLLYGKFGNLAPTVSAAWFWARIKKRTSSLYYIDGGFHTLVEALVSAIKKNGGEIITGKTLTELPKGFDKILLTIPTSIAKKLVPEISASPIPHLFAQTLILETDKPILDNVYWLNICDRSFPFLAIVAHTNFMDKKHYGGRHITYLGNYLPPNHTYLSMKREDLLKVFLPFLRRITHNAKLKIYNSFLFSAPFAQPVHQKNYSKKIPPFATPVHGVYLANMDSIVPWDRGTNYAVQLGQLAAQNIS